MIDKHYKAEIDDAGKRLDVWLTTKLSKLSRTYISKLIEDGSIVINGKTEKPGYKLRADDDIYVRIQKPKPLEITPEKIELNIIYEDNDIIVINKPRGMVVHPAAGNYSGTLVNALLEHCKDSLSDINGVIRPGIVHRIDKDTSGVIVVAKNNDAHSKLSALLKKHDIQRVYLAVAEGVIREDSGKVDAPIGRHPVDRKKMSVNLKNGRNAVTHFKVMERFKDTTLIKARLETGRTHQIRVHMSYIGHPLVGDTVYGKAKSKYSIDGQALHAMLLGFIHPTTGEYMEFTAEPPDDFAELCQTLKKEVMNEI